MHFGFSREGFWVVVNTKLYPQSNSMMLIIMLISKNIEKIKEIFSEYIVEPVIDLQLEVNKNRERFDRVKAIEAYLSNTQSL